MDADGGENELVRFVLDTQGKLERQGREYDGAKTLHRMIDVDSDDDQLRCKQQFSTYS